MTTFSESEDQTRQIGQDLAVSLRAGDIVLFWGELGAGKTTLIRGILQALGYSEWVRSPTFNLIQTFSTVPPVMHADLYRVKSYSGTGLEDYFETHLCLIEWPDRLGDLIDPSNCWQAFLEFAPDGRKIHIEPPKGGR